MGTPSHYQGCRGPTPRSARGRVQGSGRRASPMCATPAGAGRLVRHDQDRVPHQDVRRLHRRRRRQLHGPTRTGHRLPRPERRREVHDHADHGRADAGHVRHRHGLRPAVRRPAQPRPARSACSSTPPPSTPAAPAGRSSTVAARTMGLPARRVDEMLELVSLSPDGVAAAGCATTRSGMRQRLGIATALLGEPGGADPRRAGQRPRPRRASAGCATCCAASPTSGGTVLLSSHLLHEIEVIADDLVVIGQGRIVAQGTKAELLAVRRHAGADPRPADPGAGAWSTPPRVHPDPGDALRADADPDAGRQGRPRAGRRRCTELRAADGAGLEEMFLELTADTQREREGAAHDHQRPSTARRPPALSAPPGPHAHPAYPGTDPAVPPGGRRGPQVASTPGPASG